MTCHKQPCQVMGQLLWQEGAREKMGLIYAGILFMLFCSAYSSPFKTVSSYGPFLQDPELEWEKMEKVIGEEMTEALAPRATHVRSGKSGRSSTLEARRVPEYKTVSSSECQKGLFKPEKGARPLPDSVKAMLLATAPPVVTTKKPSERKLVEILCHVDRMYVRIRREVFKTVNAYKYLKLGTCPVNQGTKDHYYLLYYLKTDCDYQRESNLDYLSIRNVLHYKPTSAVFREMPFDIPLECKFPRYFHSYKVGFHPKLQGGTVLKALQPKSSFTLTPQDASGNEITGGKTYSLGQPMYFEAKQPDAASSADQRMYINKCFMTASQDPNSNPKYTVIDNHGCMIDGMATEQSKFLTGASKMMQKFSVSAFIFKDVSDSSSPQQLYMHCELSLGELVPTQSSKACNYDRATKKWKELYGDDSVCTCCESSCSSAQTKASWNVVSSHSWKVNFKNPDEYMEFKPQIRSFANSFNQEDPDMEDHRDFINYWEHDY